ncbi:uncharacterized protein [Argopecten irradians]|uniref:uncharacterized protein n=1 Tax=Argopecten irradians TaxID=31199 RepID=UPI003717238D
MAPTSDSEFLYDICCSYRDALNISDKIQDVSGIDSIDEATLNRLKSIKEQLTMKPIYPCWQALSISNSLANRCSCVDRCKQNNTISEEDLLSVLDNEGLDSVSEICREIQEFRRQCEEYGWSKLLVSLHANMKTKINLLIVRLKEGATYFDTMEFQSLVYRLNTDKADLEDAREPVTTKTLNPNEACSYVYPGNADVVVDFPVGIVESKGDIQIKLEPVVESTPLTEVVGYSDTLCIQHDEAFLKPVQMKLPLSKTGGIDLTECEFFCVHFGEDDITINENVKVDILPGNICSFETSSFSGNAVYIRRKLKTMYKDTLEAFGNEIRKLHGATTHNILLFIGDRFTEDTWKLHAEVVQQSEIKNIIKRRKKMGLRELSECQSPSINILNIRRIRITLGSNGPLIWSQASLKGRVFINVVPGGNDNFAPFPVRRINKMDMATIFFKANLTDEKLHTAYFDPRQMSRDKQRPRNDTSAMSVAASVTTRTSNRYGFWDDRSMLILAKQIPVGGMFEFFINLGIPMADYEDYQLRFADRTVELKVRLIHKWISGEACSDEERAAVLCEALEKASLKLLADKVKKGFNERRALVSDDFLP